MYAYSYTNTLEYHWWIVINRIDPCPILANEKRNSDDQALDQVPRGKESCDWGEESHACLLSVGIQSYTDVLVLILYILCVLWEIAQICEVAEREFVPVTRYNCQQKKDAKKEECLSQDGRRNSRHLGDSLMKRALMHNRPPGISWTAKEMSHCLLLLGMCKLIP